MKSLLIVHFGDSIKYRLDDSDENRRRLSRLREEIKEYVEKTYPMLNAKDYYSQMSVKMVDADAEPEYLQYPEFKDEDTGKIENEIDIEVANHEDQRMLDRNAPFAEIDNNTPFQQK